MVMGLGKVGVILVINGYFFQEKIDKVLEVYWVEGIIVYGYLFDVMQEIVVIDSVVCIELEVGLIDIFVNNVGIIKCILFVEMSVEEWDQVICIDLIGVFIMFKYVVKGMMECGLGKIINICFMMSELGRNIVGVYVVVKGGLKMFM